MLDGMREAAVTLINSIIEAYVETPEDLSLTLLLRLSLAQAEIDEQALAAKEAAQEKEHAEREKAAKKTEELAAKAAEEVAKYQRKAEEARLKAIAKQEEEESKAAAKRLKEEAKLAKKAEEARQQAERAERAEAAALAKKKAEESKAARIAQEAKAAQQARAADEAERAAHKAEQKRQEELKKALDVAATVQRKKEEEEARLAQKVESKRIADEAAADTAARKQEQEAQRQKEAAAETRKAGDEERKAAAAVVVPETESIRSGVLDPLLTDRSETVTAAVRQSTAGKISNQRLERASTRSRLSSLWGGRDKDDDESEFGTFELMRTKDTAASRALKESKSCPPSEPVLVPRKAPKAEVAPASKLAAGCLQRWRSGGASKPVEMPAEVGFTGTCLTVHADSDTIVCIGSEGDGKLVSVYSAGSAELLQTLRGHTDLVCSVAVQGDVIASGGRDKTIRLWSRATGECTATLQGCEDLVYGLAMRDTLLVSGEGSGKVRLWSLVSAMAVAVFSDHFGPVWSVAITRKVAVSGSHDKHVRLWPIDGTTACVGKLVHPNWVYSVSVDNVVDPTLVSTGCGDGRVRVWSLVTRECLRTLEHHGTEWVLSVCLLGSVLISGGADKMVKVWSLSDGGECVATLTHGAKVRGVSIAPSLAFIVSTGGKKLHIWR